MLPPVICYLAVEVQWFSPSELLADTLNLGQKFGVDGAIATMIFIIGGTTAVIDECALDSSFDVAWHVAIEVLHA